MPKRHEPKLLNFAAMTTIARNFDYLGYNVKNKIEMSSMIENGRYLNYEGPFQKLPGSLLAEIMLTIGEDVNVRHLRRKHIHLLVLPQLTSFRFTSGDTAFALDILIERCKLLRKLDLSYMRAIQPPAFLLMIPNFTQLIQLNLTMTELTDQVLGEIGKYCTELQSLDASCCPITGRGIVRLCYDEEYRTVRCRKLIRLNVLGCHVTGQHLWFLKQKIPTLRELDFENNFQIFNMMEGVGDPLKTLTAQNLAFHLAYLTSTDDGVTQFNADIAMALCPLITSLTLNNSHVENEVLYKAMNLNYLTHLRITNNDKRTIDFHEGVLPLLTVKGNQIESLLLANFISIDITAIGDCCPNLKNFAVSSILIYEDILYPKETIFNKLTTLEIWSDLSQDTVSTVILKQLLCYCPQIRKILVSGSHLLGDELFLNIWKTNDMRALERITLENCPAVSKLFVDLLLNTENQVTLIRMWSCFLITQDDDKKIRKKIKQENCDVYFEWFPWQG